MGEDQKEVVLTYETLYEAVRRERSKDELQKLEKTFYHDVLSYLTEKQKTHDDSLSKQDMFSQNEREKTTMQLANIKKLIREIYDLRERKLLNMAINKSRTGSDIIDTSNLLPEETPFYESVLANLNQYRQSILVKIQNLRSPDIPTTTTHTPNTQEPSTTSVKFTQPIESFVDEDLQLYGPYDINDEAELPQKLAQVLIKQGKAEPA